MKWLDDLDNTAKYELERLAGAINIPAPKEYATLGAFLFMVRTKISEAKYAVRQLGWHLDV